MYCKQIKASILCSVLDEYLVQAQMSVMFWQHLQGKIIK